MDLIARRAWPILTALVIGASGSLPAVFHTGVVSVVRQRPDSVLAGCETAQLLARRVLGLETTLEPRAAVINDFLGRQARPRPGCRVSGRTDADRGPAPVDDLVAALQAEGWQALLAYMADGPDGAHVGLRRGPALCLIRGSWDGGDDRDPAYVPAPGYALEVKCFRRTPADDRS